MSIYQGDDYTLRDFVTVAKALSDPSRVRILLSLRAGELCVCQIVDLLGLAASTVSRHMSVLRQAYLVDSRKDGRWVFYRRVDQQAMRQARGALRWIDDSIGESAAAASDAERLAAIRAVPPEELCLRLDRG